VVSRSDGRLREVLQSYQRTYEANLAKDALKKSNNLVVTICVKAFRTNVLVRHAIEDISSKSRSVELRYELLMSRLIRLHWDRLHFGRVKEEYRNKYRTDLRTDVKDATKGDFGEFCVQLCET